MKRILYGFLVFIMLIACRALTPSTIPTQNMKSDTTSSVDTPTTLAPAQTPILSEEITPIPESTQSSSLTYFSWVNIASQESEGMKIDLAYLTIMDKSSVSDFSLMEFLDNKQTVCIVDIRITNTSSQPLSLFFTKAEATVGNEHIPLGEYFSYYNFGDPLGGEMQPGDSAVGAIMFGIENSSLLQTKNIIFHFKGPVDPSGVAVGKDYIFNLDLSDRQQQPKPEDLP